MIANCGFQIDISQRSKIRNQNGLETIMGKEFILLAPCSLLFLSLCSSPLPPHLDKRVKSGLSAL